MGSRPQRYLLGLSAALAVSLAAALLLWQPRAGDGDGAAPSASPPPPELTGLLATTDLSVGANRVSFLLVSPQALITVPQASVTSLYVPPNGSPPILGEQKTARFYLWPYGTRGNYATELTFDRPGDWELDVKVQNTDGTIESARVFLEVTESSITPAIGSGPPAASNKTLRDVSSLAQLTSWSTPDPELYQKSIPEAVGAGQPLLVVFASPAFCTSPTCGPQVETVGEVKERYKDRASFIHVEVYDNPDEIQGNLDLARYSPVVEAWGLPGIEGYLNESWVFILDREGRITAKYEGFASAQELEEGLLRVLQPQVS